MPWRALDKTWAWLHPSPAASAPPEREDRAGAVCPRLGPEETPLPRPRQVVPISGSFAGPSGRHLCCQGSWGSGSCCVLKTLCPLPRGPPPPLPLMASAPQSAHRDVQPHPTEGAGWGGQCGRALRPTQKPVTEPPCPEANRSQGAHGPCSQQLRARRGVSTHAWHRGFCASLRPCQGLEEDLLE